MVYFYPPYWSGIFLLDTTSLMAKNLFDQLIRRRTPLKLYQQLVPGPLRHPYLYLPFPSPLHHFFNQYYLSYHRKTPQKLIEKNKGISIKLFSLKFFELGKQYRKDSRKFCLDLCKMRY